MKKILTAIALATVLATPAFAATVHHQAPQSTEQQLQSSPRMFMYAPDATIGIGDPARAAAMQACNAAAAKWSNSAWETTQLATYGTCMAEHGQTP